MDTDMNTKSDAAEPAGAWRARDRAGTWNRRAAALGAAIVCLAWPGLPVPSPGAGPAGALGAGPAEGVEAGNANGRGVMVIVVGAPGEDRFQEVFVQAADQLQQLAQQGGLQVDRLDGNDAGEGASLDAVRESLESAPADRELWLVMFGHGTWDGREARFNLDGDDLTASALAGWLQARDGSALTVVVNTTAASAPFLDALSGPGRVVITATRSGSEVQYSHFGPHWVEALADLDGADLDRDGEVSLLESFLTASRRVAGFYERELRMRTEHALIDDNGDRRGTPAEWWEGLRLVRQAAGDGVETDGELARRVVLVPASDRPRLTPEQERRVIELEREVERLRGQRDQLATDDYYQRMEQLLVELAELMRPDESARERDGPAIGGHGSR